MQYTDTRAFTFDVTYPINKRTGRCWTHAVPNAQHLAECGFYFTPVKKYTDQITCISCKGKETNVNGISNIVDHHLVSSPECALSRIYSHKIDYLACSDQDKSKYWTNQPIFSDPKSAEAVEIRRKTFGKFWKFDKQQSKSVLTSDKLAEAGFFYCPQNERTDDKVECVYCHVTLDSWQPNDDALKEHRNNAGHFCYFLSVCDPDYVAERDDINDISLGIPSEERQFSSDEENSLINRGDVIPRREALSRGGRRVSTQNVLSEILSDEDEEEEKEEPERSHNVKPVTVYISDYENGIDESDYETVSDNYEPIESSSSIAETQENESQYRSDRGTQKSENVSYESSDSDANKDKNAHQTRSQEVDLVELESGTEPESVFDSEVDYASGSDAGPAATSRLSLIMKERRLIQSVFNDDSLSDSLSDDDYGMFENSSDGDLHSESGELSEDIEVSEVEEVEEVEEVPVVETKKRSKNTSVGQRKRGKIESKTVQPSSNTAPKTIPKTALNPAGPPPNTASKTTSKVTRSNRKLDAEEPLTNGQLKGLGITIDAQAQEVTKRQAKKPKQKVEEKKTVVKETVVEAKKRGATEKKAAINKKATTKKKETVNEPKESAKGEKQETVPLRRSRRNRQPSNEPSFIFSMPKARKTSTAPKQRVTEDQNRSDSVDSEENEENKGNESEEESAAGEDEGEKESEEAQTEESDYEDSSTNYSADFDVSAADASVDSVDKKLKPIKKPVKKETKTKTKRKSSDDIEFNAPKKGKIKLGFVKNQTPTFIMDISNQDIGDYGDNNLSFIENNVRKSISPKKDFKTKTKKAKSKVFKIDDTDESVKESKVSQIRPKEEPKSKHVPDLEPKDTLQNQGTSPVKNELPSDVSVSTDVDVKRGQTHEREETKKEEEGAGEEAEEEPGEAQEAGEAGEADLNSSPINMRYDEDIRKIMEINQQLEKSMLELSDSEQEQDPENNLKSLSNILSGLDHDLVSGKLSDRISHGTISSPAKESLEGSEPLQLDSKSNSPEIGSTRLEQDLSRTQTSSKSSSTESSHEQSSQNNHNLNDVDSIQKSSQITSKKKSSEKPKSQFSEEMTSEEKIYDKPIETPSDKVSEKVSEKASKISESTNASENPKSIEKNPEKSNQIKLYAAKSTINPDPSDPLPSNLGPQPDSSSILHHTKDAIKDVKSLIAQPSSPSSEITDPVLDKLNTMEQTCQYLEKMTKVSYTLKDDMEGELTQFIASMPEEEENLTIKQWIEFCADNCSKIVTESCDEIISKYKQEVENGLKQLNSLPTID